MIMDSNIKTPVERVCKYWLFYTDLSRAARKEFRDEVCEINEWQMSNFYDKIHGKKNISPKQKERMEQIIRGFAARYRIAFEYEH